MIRFFVVRYFNNYYLNEEIECEMGILVSLLVLKVDESF